ncbi:PAS domain S-box-containing protein/diguanylate cyclase (GGDEF) domain-containing protein [Sphingomonas laterariae]|uniref:PAS domain S-box-containing protein/diguanylate cyclase (GGDEF) domain-containing protein n=1 Tax=Edaphosphingomonas laterariae TaxID=861865 RepID=A0A239KS92_9SPHN|nr:EAL domain-containing protein [Sphingomonas laterariae]SNT20925.1 PAS domain S-box-containing protein/diguanylate cyclase (GGDEF) domain-containing protein [Sphingomonas laterariae]
MGSQAGIGDRLTSWLLGGREALPEAISVQLRNGLFTSVPIFLGGILNTSAVASVAVWRHPTAEFIAWLGFEIALGAIRLVLLLDGRRLVRQGRTPKRLPAALLSCCWAASVGVGTYLCITSEDWVLATIACLSAAAMVCGICLRNFGTPRLAAIMVLLALLPCAFAGLMTAEPIMPMISIQLPIFMLTILAASFSLHRMMVSWMRALSDLQSSRSLNEIILHSSPDYTLILDEAYHVAFCNGPNSSEIDTNALQGRDWLSLLPDRDRELGLRAIQIAHEGRADSLITQVRDSSGERRWFHVIVNAIQDGSRRLIVVARDITQQKLSEERAIWMAQHDSLTGLPNRTVLQEQLDVLLDGREAASGALLVVDVDNFKSINDTLGHDAGDRLLCAFAQRLQTAVGNHGLVARTGGDEFAILLHDAVEMEVRQVAARIFELLAEPIDHGGRLIECGASVGASLMPRDGALRSEVMKAADVALYAAKTGGRAQLRIFEQAMMEEVENHQGMIASARYALQCDTIIAHYQPKICLRTSQVAGFEALLRWKDGNGQLRGPGSIHAAFNDPALGAQLSDRMLTRILDDIEAWARLGIAFGSVAINVTAADFRRGGFAETILSRLEERNIAPGCIQIEVTESVFLGHSTGSIKAALERLGDHGIRIALDDFGTGYASLSHLSEFPVHILKIDRSFIERLGESPDSDAISTMVINLGHCFGLQVVAEGVETREQADRLVAMGCDLGQGFYYSAALAEAAVVEFIAAGARSGDLTNAAGRHS